MSSSTGIPCVHTFSRLMAGATFLLLIAGGLVTSTGSGLAVPDWPLSYGRFFPPMVGGILYEHGHRMIAGTVAILTVILAAWLWRTPSLGRRRWLGVAAVGVVLAQALLGGLTVVRQLPPVVSVGHACVGQGFFCLMVSIALVTSSAWTCLVPVDTGDGVRLRRPAFMATCFLALQLVTGAVVRHTGIGVPVHALLAMAAAVHIVLLGKRIMASHADQPLLSRPMMALGALLALQLCLGVGALLVTVGASTPPTPAAVLLRTAHMAVGALLSASSLIITLCAYRLYPPERAASHRGLATEAT